jgi:hypothetical protein
MKTKFALTVLAFAVAATSLVLQQKKTVSQLREQNRVLQEQITQLEALRDENVGQANLKMDATEMQQLRGEHAELLRLRGEVGRLRQATTAGNAGFRPPLDVSSEVDELAQEKIDQAALAKEMISQATADEAKQARTFAKQLGVAARIFATDHNNKFPATFNEMKNELTSLAVDSFVDAYEYVQHARPVSERDPDKLLFRERAPRRLPDGKWARVYTMCDGSVREQISDDGNFEEWESAHLAKDATEK